MREIFLYVKGNVMGVTEKGDERSSQIYWLKNMSLF